MITGDVFNDIIIDRTITAKIAASFSLPPRKDKFERRTVEIWREVMQRSLIESSVKLEIDQETNTPIEEYVRVEIIGDITSRRGTTISDMQLGKIDLNLFVHGQFAFVSNLYIDPYITGRGLGQKLHEICDEIARRHGYELIMCTTNGSSPTHETLLVAMGWKVLAKWENPNSSNNCTTWVKEL